tara:strand:- start:90 stop:2315 length:2226 start_codon:yes stop_codon:yes gene_type:complete
MQFRENFHLAFVASLLTLLLYLLQHFMLEPPDPKGLDAPQDEFSAVRAFSILEVLLQENKPHPVGSKLNKVVKDRLKGEFKKLGLEYQEQKTWACATRYSGCAEVENLIAIMPGKSDLPYLALMAHYDSVPMAPGAGDDGAGIVAILEAARALKLEAPFKHPIMIIFTDAEEVGLIGAEGFFKQHPLAQKVGIVLNVEGSGTSGSSLVLRTSKDNELLIKSYSNETSSAYGFSFVKELFKRMPNDTDFSVVQRANIPGIDFAFAGERNHYHTPNDTIENLDLRTLQHHGENILPLARSLANSDWTSMGGQYVYGGKLYGVWTQWNSSYSFLLTALASILLLVSLFRSKLNIIKVIYGVLSSPLILASTVFTAYAAFQLLSIFSGKVISWPGIEWPYRLLLLSSSLVGTFIGISIVRRYLDSIDMLYGAWIFWSILSFITISYLPDAANTFIIPLVAASLILFLSDFIAKEKKLTFSLLTLVLAVPTTISIIFSLEQSQGYKLVVAVLPLIGLYAILISPFLFCLRVKPLSIGAALVSIFCLVVASNINLYTEHRPQHVNINYYENLDSGKSYVNLSSQEPLLEPLRSFVDVDTTQQLIPYSSRVFSNWTESDTSNWQAPNYETEYMQNGFVKLTLKSLRSADRMALIIPVSSGLLSFDLGKGEERPIGSNEIYTISFSGVYDNEIEVILRFEDYTNMNEAYLIDISTKLPSHLDTLLQLRSGLFSPVHRGDQAVLIRRISI